MSNVVPAAEIAIFIFHSLFFYADSRHISHAICINLLKLLYTELVITQDSIDLVLKTIPWPEDIVQRVHNRILIILQNKQ